MKKILISFVLMISLLGATSATASAAINFDQFIYEDSSQAKQYLAISKTSFLVAVANKKIKDFNYKYLRLTNNTYYTKTTYLVNLAQSSEAGLNFDQAMERLAAKGPQTVANIKDGKVANNGTIIDKAATDNTVAPEPEVKEFKVVNIQ